MKVRTVSLDTLKWEHGGTFDIPTHRAADRVAERALAGSKSPATKHACLFVARLYRKFGSESDFFEVLEGLADLSEAALRLRREMRQEAVRELSKSKNPQN